MARKTPSRKELRKQAEAVDAQEKAGTNSGTKKKKAKKKAVRKTSTTRARRAKEKAPQRKRLVWGVFSGSMKEEARFPYDQRKEADEKIAQLRARSKKLYFIQPIKEPIPEPAPAEDE